MPSESFRNALYDIRDNILFAQEIVAGLDYPSFVESRREPADRGVADRRG
jgi:hypothetical protein